MRNRLILPFLPILILSSCSKSNFILESKIFCFDTLVDIRLYEGEAKNLQEIEKYARFYSKISDNYQEYDVTNIYSINQTNNTYTVAPELYDMISNAKEIWEEKTAYFNPLCGSISKLWKESLLDGHVPSNDAINNCLNSLSSSGIVLSENNRVNRVGSAEIDLGGFAKGYTLDIIQDYLKESEIKHYLIDAGSSSILLGEKKTDDGLFSVGIKDLTNTYLKLKNCFVSTSSISNQGVKIGNITYSHIVDPFTGSAINKHDAVVVISDNGALGDALSTAFMLMDIEEIKTMEASENVKTIVIENGNIVYKNPGIEVFNH